MIETLGDPPSAVAELRRVTKPDGVVGAASVEYGGIIIGGWKTAGLYRFYDIRQLLWRGARIAEPDIVVPQELRPYLPPPDTGKANLQIVTLNSDIGLGEGSR